VGWGGAGWGGAIYLHADVYNICKVSYERTTNASYSGIEQAATECDGLAPVFVAVL